MLLAYQWQLLLVQLQMFRAPTELILLVYHAALHVYRRVKVDSQLYSMYLGSYSLT